MSTFKRDSSIDIIRGIAIVIMLGANVVGYVTSCELHPLWFDIYSSLAAPMFILLSGYMVAINSSKKHKSLNYYLLRAGMIMLTAAIIDGLIWQLLPFASFDVLYVIGLGMLVVFLLEKSHLTVKFGFIAAVLLISFLLQHTWEYMEFPLEIEFLSGEADYSAYSFFNVIKAWLYDGWFPVFPWIAFPVLGSIFAHFRKQYTNGFAEIKPVLYGAALTIAGFAWLYFAYTEGYAFDLLVKREPYGEIFYPATVPFMIATFGVCLLVFAFIDKTRESIVWKPLTIFGQTSLFNYILHTGIIAYIVTPVFNFEEVGLHPLYMGWIVYGLLVLVSYIFSYGVTLIKRKVKTRNFLFNFYFGG